MRSQTARSRASMLHDATTPGPAADAKSRPPDSQPARIEEAERAVGAPASLRRGPGRGLVPALDRPGAGVRHRVRRAGCRSRSADGDSDQVQTAVHVVRTDQEVRRPDLLDLAAQL